MLWPVSQVQIVTHQVIFRDCHLREKKFNVYIAATLETKGRHPESYRSTSSTTKSQHRSALCFPTFLSHTRPRTVWKLLRAPWTDKSKEGKMVDRKSDCEMWERGVFGRAHLVCSVNPRGLCFFAEGNARIVGPGDRGYGPARGPARQVGTNNKMKVS